MISPCDTCGNRIENHDPEGCWRGYGSTGLIGRFVKKLFGCEGYKKLYQKPNGAETVNGSCTSKSKNKRSTSETHTSSGTSPGSRHNKKPVSAVHPRWIIIGLTFIGALLRGFNLDTNSLWLDEAATSFFSTPGILKIWESTVAGEFNPPLFYVLEHFMIGTFGNTELILRVLPAIFGTLAIPVFYHIGKEFKDEFTGILMAVMCTVSPFLIWYSQEARAYTLLLLLIAWTTYFFFRALRTDNLWDWIPFAVIGAIAFWVHFYAMVFMAALVSYAIFAFLMDKERNKKIKPFLISICIYTAILFPLLVSMGGLVAKRTASAPTYGIQGIGLMYATYQQLSGFSELILIFFIGLFVVGTITTLYWNRGKGIFLIWIPIVIAVASVFASGIIPMLPRYLIPLSVFFYLGIAMSFKAIGDMTNWEKKTLVTVFSIVLVVLAVPFLSNYYSTPTKEDWRQVSTDLQQLTDRGDTVVTVPTYLDLPLNYYYSSFRDGTDIQGSITAAGLELARANANGTVWYIVTGDIMAADPTGSSLNWLHENTKTIGHYRGDIYILKGI